MRLVLSEPKYLKESIAIISDLVSEVRLKVDKDKIELIAMDPANVAMIIFKLLSSAFVEYNVEKETEIAVNLGSLHQILRRAKPTDVLTLELEKNRLKINLKGETNRTFHLSLIDIEEREQKIPDLKFPLKIETHSWILDEAIEDMGVVAESVAFMVENGRFTIKSEGSLSAAKVEVNKDEFTNVDSAISDDITSRYSLEYLKKMIKGSKLSERVLIQFAKDYPLKMEYNVVDKLKMEFILAPRVSND